jgi:hypothetical protein
MSGVITMTDVVRQLSRCQGSSCTVAVFTIMTDDVVFCRKTDQVYDIWTIMKERRLKNIPVTDETCVPIGLLNARDALEVLLVEVEQEESLLRDYVMCVGYPTMVLVTGPRSKRMHESPASRAATPTAMPHGPAPITAMSMGLLLEATVVTESPRRTRRGLQDHAMHGALLRLRAIERNQPETAVAETIEMIAIVRAEGDSGFARREDEAAGAVHIGHVDDVPL